MSLYYTRFNCIRGLAYADTLILYVSLGSAQPPKQQEQWNQRQRKEQRPALPVNDAVDHLRADVDTKQANYQDSESVSHDSQGNYKRDQKDAAPWTLQKQVGGQDTGNEKDPARPNSAALLGDLDDDSRQLEDRAIPQHGCTGQAEEEGRDFCRSKLRCRFKPMRHTIGQGNHEDQKREREGRSRHPFSPEEKKSCRRDESRSMQSAVRDCESLALRVTWNAPFTPKNAPRPAIAKKAAQPNDDSYFLGSSFAADKEEIRGQERNQQDMGMQIGCGRVADQGDSAVVQSDRQKSDENPK